MRKKKRQPEISLTLSLSLFHFHFLSILLYPYVCTRFHTIVFFIAYFTPLTHYSIHSLLLILTHMHARIWFRTFLCWITTKAFYTKCDTLCTQHTHDWWMFVSFLRTAVILVKIWTSHCRRMGKRKTDCELMAVVAITISKSKSSQIIIFIVYLSFPKRMFTTDSFISDRLFSFFFPSSMRLCSPSPSAQQTHNHKNNENRLHDCLVIAN